VNRRHGSAIAAVAAVALTAVLLGGCGDDPARAIAEGDPAADDRRVLVAFGLDRDDAELAAFVDAVSGPDATEGFLTAEQLRRRFGASPAVIRDATDRLESIGIEGARLDASGAVLVAEVSAEQARTVLGAPLVEQDRADGSRVVLPERDPDVPDALRGPITEVVGLTATVESAADALVGPQPAGPVDPGCGSAELATSEDVAAANEPLGTAPLYDAGHQGEGVTIALWSVEAYAPAPVQAFATCRQSPTVQPRLVDVALTPPAPTGDEVTLDVIMAGWTAPGADLVVVRFDPYASLVFPMVQTLEQSEQGPAPIDLLSTSISVCEEALPAAELELAEHLLMALAATGTTTVAAAGDHGVAGCWPGSTDPMAAYPASSAYATAVGGTSFVRDGSRIVGEEAWREGDASGDDGVAGGGGSSDRLDLPRFQRRAGLTGTRRAYPDTSSLAAVDRINAIPRCDATACTWSELGGTSAVAPTLAGNLAVSLGAARANGAPGERIGWLNPWLAAWAERDDGLLVDLTEGSTAVLGNRCCTAGPGWDAATGWGSIRRFDLVAKRLDR
jgi:kumamolisin